MKEQKMLTMGLRADEVLTIGDDVVVEVLNYKRNPLACRVRVRAPEDVPIGRREDNERKRKHERARSNAKRHNGRPNYIGVYEGEDASDALRRDQQRAGRNLYDK